MASTILMTDAAATCADVDACGSVDCGVGAGCSTDAVPPSPNTVGYLSCEGIGMLGIALIVQQRRVVVVAFGLALVMREASTCQMISQRRRPSSEQHAAQEWSTFH
jgi:hypothetical protein